MQTVDTQQLLNDLDVRVGTAYVEAKRAADAAQDALNEAADMVKALCVPEIVLPDGTRVAVENRDRTTYDAVVLKRILSKSLFRKVTKRVAVTSSVKEALNLGLLTEREAAKAANVTPVEQVRVYKAN